MREVSFSDGATASPLLASVLPGRPVSLLCEAAETEAEEAGPGWGRSQGGAELGLGRGGARVRGGAQEGRVGRLRRSRWARGDRVLSL